MRIIVAFCIYSNLSKFYITRPLYKEWLGSTRGIFPRTITKTNILLSASITL